MGLFLNGQFNLLGVEAPVLPIDSALARLFGTLIKDFYPLSGRTKLRLKGQEYLKYLGNLKDQFRDINSERVLGLCDSNLYNETHCPLEGHPLELVHTNKLKPILRLPSRLLPQGSREDYLPPLGPGQLDEIKEPLILATTAVICNHCPFQAMGCHPEVEGLFAGMHPTGNHKLFYPAISPEYS